MKPLRLMLSTLVLITMSTGVFAQLRLGAGGGFAFDTESFTLFARASYDFTDLLRANATYNYYFVDETNDVLGIDADAFDVNLDFNYDFANLPTIDFYALAGLNVFRVTAEALGKKEGNTEAGLNLGVGGLFGIADKIDFLAEFKYTIGGTEQLFFNAGLMFNINGSR